MSKIAAFLGSNSGLVVGAGVFVVGAIGAGAYLGVLAPKDAIEPAILVAQPAEQTTPEPKVVDVQPSVVEPTPIAVTPAETEPKAIFKPSAPTVDEVRNEADGLTVIAGRAEPGSDVVLLVDGAANMTMTVGADGTFAAVTVLPPNGDAQVLTIVQQIEGTELAADDIILAPRDVAVEDVVVAAVVPEVELEIEPQDSDQTGVAAVDPVAQAAEVIAPTVAAAVVRPDPQPEPKASDVEVEPVAPDAVAPDAVAPDAVVAAVEPATPSPEPDAKPEIKPEPQQELVTEPVAEPVTEQVAILKADETGVEIINRSSAPDVMSNVAIDTISYSQGGDVLLSGRAQSQASAVRVYLNNAVITTLEVDTSGRWRGDLPDVDTGIYTLRVDEVDEGGDVTSRVETPFKREAPAVLAAAQNDTDKPVKAITVQTGATLWAIARERYGDGTLYVRVVDANKANIRNPDLIYPGQVFELPE
jgi:nucleoid-associated protein YgaU